VDNIMDTYTTSLTYDTYGNVTFITDAESNTATLTYSPSYSSAYLTEISAVVGSETITTRATYDYYRGWTTSVQDPKGVAAGSGYDYLYTYDVLGRVIKKEFPLLPGQSQRSYIEAVYDCENRTTTLIDPLGHYIVREHDKLGRLTAVKTYTGEFGSGILYATSSYTYNYADQVLTVTDPLNHMTLYAYDSLGRIIQVLSPDLSTASFSYDDTNNKMIFTDGSGYDRITWFDWLSRLTKVEEEYEPNLFAVTTFQYDEVNNLVSFTDAENRTTSYIYGSLFGLTQITYPDSTYEACTYDNTGSLISFIDANGNEITYTYDSIYRLTHVEFEDQSTVSFAYDLNSNRTRMVDNAPNQGDYVEYYYDPWNRLSTETRHISLEAYTVSYQYDEASRLTHLSYPNNMQILYYYDDLNRITEIKRYIDGINDEILMDNVQYNAKSLITQFDYGNELQTFFSFDVRDRLLTINVEDGETPYLDLDYTYDGNSNITQVENGWRDINFDWHSQTESYSYDGLDRLLSASSASWSNTYSYDRAGNRMSKDGVTYTVNAVNEVTSLSDGTSFTYDANGNRTQKTTGSDTWEYTYDYANRLTKVEKNSVVLEECVYDGNGQRIQVTENNETTTYIYSGLNILYKENTTGTAAYIYGPTGRLALRTTVDTESHTFYYHTDHLGSTRVVTDESRTVVTDAVYEPFGETVVTGEEPFLYTGKEKDSTGLSYYNARYYDPETGCFITRDPLAGKKALPQTLNRYTYCLNNPVKYIDPTGLCVERLCNYETGVCMLVYCHYRKDGLKWTAYNTKGEKITDSKQMEDLLSSGKLEDQAKAAYLMLLITHPEIQGDPAQNGTLQTEGYMNEGYLFEVAIEGEKVYVWIVIRDEFESAEGYPAYTFLMGIVEGGKMIDVIKLTIFQSAFQSYTHLYHVIGHEGVHIYELATTGFTSEVYAFKWNLEHANSVPYPWDMGELIQNYRNAKNPYHSYGPAIPA